MDAARIVEIVDRVCAAAGSRWSVIGGIAMNAYGHARATYDFDVAAEDARKSEILSGLASEGFAVVNDSPAFSNLLHSDNEIGRLDFLWLDDATAARIFSRAREVAFRDSLRILVPAPEHLISMKVDAIRNQPTRVFRDGADLQFLLAAPGLDHNAVRETFARAGLAELYRRLHPEK